MTSPIDRNSAPSSVFARCWTAANACACSIGFTVLFFTPLQLFVGNSEEFSVSLLSLTLVQGLAAAVLSAVIAGILSLIPGTVARHLLAPFFAFGFMLFVQGNYFLWDYGLLNGQAIEWERNTSRGWLEVSTWTIVILAAVIARKSLLTRIPPAAAVVLIVQFLTLVLGLFSFQSHPHQQYFIDGRPLMRFSATQNVIFVIVDAFQSTSFEELRADRPEFEKTARGFTYFRNATSGYTSTMGSIPNMLTGQFNRNETPLPTFMREAYQNSVFTAAKAHGYQVELYPLADKVFWFDPLTIDNIVAGSTIKRAWAEFPALLDLTIFRHLPHWAKKIWLGERSSLVPAKEDSSRRSNSGIERLPTGLGPVRDKAFYDRLSDLEVIQDTGPRFKLIHLGGAHAPYRLDENLNFADLPDSQEGYDTQAAASMRIVREFLEELQGNGIYDSSTIVIAADHGVWFNSSYRLPSEHQGADPRPDTVGHHIISAGLPLVLIKAAGTQEPFTINDAPVELSDLPATLAELVLPGSTFPGRSMYSIDPGEIRERRHYYYDFEGWNRRYLPTLNEYVINGFSWNPKSWTQSENSFARADRTATAQDLNLGEWFAFGADEAVTDVCGIGWGNPEAHHIWSSETNVRLNIPLLEPQTVILSLDILPFVREGISPVQNVIITSNGVRVGKWQATHTGVYVVTLPKALFKDGQARLDLHLPNAISPSHDLHEYNDPRTLGIMLRRIRLDPFPTLPEDLTIIFGKSGNQKAFTGSGWSGAEAKAMWTVGPESTLSFHLPASVGQTRKYILEVAGTPVIIPDKVVRNELSAFYNGTQVATWSVTGSSVNKTRLTLDEEGPHILTFRPGRTVTPAEQIPGITDTRPLGFRFSRLSLQAIKSPN
jgi:hypothetical protein